MSDEAAAEGVETEGATGAEESTAGEPFGAEETGELTAGESTGEAAESTEDQPELFSVRVGGKEQQVSLDELTKGFMLQADYTRKTQELAAQRQQVEAMFVLQNALQNDPRTTLAALAGQLGVDLGFGQQAPAQQADDADPLEILAREVEALRTGLSARERAELEARQAAQTQANLRAQIDNEIATLKAQHGEFDHMQLIQYAVDHQSPNLDLAWNAWQYEQQQLQKIAERNATVAAKRKAQVVSGGNATAGAGAVTQGTNGGGRMSAREAIAAAFAAHS